MDISEKRTAAVANELVQKHHINSARLSSAGVGPEGRKLNRRVELAMKK